MSSTPNLKITSWNARGFAGAVPYLRKLVKDNDIVAVSEHWLHGNKLNRLAEVSDKVNFCARASQFSKPENYGIKRGQGGVALFWKKELVGVSEFTSIIHDRICGIRLQTERGGILNIFSVYLPAMGCGEDYGSCLDDMAEVLESRELESVSIICGDCNGDIGRNRGVGNPRVPNKNGVILGRFIDEFGLIPCNLSKGARGPLYTHVGNQSTAVLDYILVAGELEENVIKCHTSYEETLNTSDHKAVSIELCIDSLRDNSVECRKERVIRWDKVDKQEISLRYKDPLDSKLRYMVEKLGGGNVSKEVLDECIEELNFHLKEAAKAIPTAKFRAHLRPYWNQTLTLLKKDKVKKFRRWVDAGRPKHPDNQVWHDHKLAKKNFAKELRRLSRQYEDEQVAAAVKAANIDKGLFWRLVKKSRSTCGGKTTGIRDVSGKVVNNIDAALEVWRTHFSNLGTPKPSSEYDNDHYVRVTKVVAELNKSDEPGQFLDHPFDENEVRKALGKLHKRKSSGLDGISTEHLIYAGDGIVQVLTAIYNHMLRLEYVPLNLRRGIQIPLFKGKGLCCLDVNSYRGISLLTNYNKVYEILLWGRMSKWWEANKVISDLQGAGKRGQSCVHTAFVLQEAISAARAKGHKVFVSYFDVSKAYDTVWTDGLFYQLHGMGITGKMWRMMYRAYIDFKCKVRLGDQLSDWYPLLCGIHQGGFLSLTKYVAFINSLILELEKSKLCCQIRNVSASPSGYADDLAAACVSKCRIDRVMTIVNNYGRKWRFHFNAKKSAVLVYGEERRERDIGKENRTYRLGKDKVLERFEYDHVGIKACILRNNSRVEEKIGKGRRALNAAAGLGIRKNGLSVATCNMIFWTIVVPIVTFGCELWSLQDDDIHKLNVFQRYAGRRVQRFSQRSPGCSSFYGLGWIRIETLILVKKVLFIHSILRITANAIITGVFKVRVIDYIKDRTLSEANNYDSPVFDLLNAGKRLGLLGVILDILGGVRPIGSKTAWSKIVWERAWALDDTHWRSMSMVHNSNDMLFYTIPSSRYLCWWQIADYNPLMQRVSETMAKLICRASRLKSDDPTLKDTSIFNRMCTNCEMGVVENVYHMVLQCPFTEDIRRAMFDDMASYVTEFSNRVKDNPSNTLAWLLGRTMEEIEAHTMCTGLEISGSHIYSMYRRVINSRKGIG